MPLPYTREAPRVDAAGAPPPPEPSLWESVPAAFRAAKDAIPYVQKNRVREAYFPVMAALGERNGKGPFAYNNNLNQFTGFGDPYDYDAIWRDIEDERKRDPKAFSNLPGTRDEFERSVLTRGGANATDSDIAVRGGLLPQIAGGLGASFFDPVNMAAGIVTGGASKGLPVLRAMLVDGIANASVELVEAPATIEAHKRLGVEIGAKDVAAFAGTAFVFGAGLRGAMELPGASRGGFERAVAANWDRLPDGLRTRWEARATMEPAQADLLLADLSEAIIGRDRLSEAEADALAVIRREGEIDVANPFLPNGAGDAAHLGAIGQTIARIMADEPAARPAALPPRAAVSLVPPRMGNPRGGTAIASGVVPGDATARFMQRVRSAESGGNDLAQAGTSSAFGRYQFTKGTWISYYTRRFGTQGLSREAILAKRADGRLQDLLMGDLTADNAARLRRIGAPATEGNLYLAHFLGPADAERVLRASPDTPLAGLINSDSIAANPKVLAGKTAGDVIRFADRKMGGAGSAGDGVHVRPDAGMEPELRNQIDAELASVRAETAQIEAELRAQGVDTETALADAFGGEDVGLKPLDGPEVLLEQPQRPRAPDAPPPEIEAILPRLRDVVADKGQKLNDFDTIAAEIGATPQEVRQGLMELVKDKAGGGVSVRRKDGAFIRRGPAFGRRMTDGPEDVLDFIARNGGIRDDEGHALGLKGLSAKQRNEMISDGARRRAELSRQGGDRGWKRMTRFNGPLLRHEGRSVDQVGELLHDAGYLHGADGGRPTTADVLAYLDQRIGDNQPRFAREDQAMAGADLDTVPVDVMGWNGRRVLDPDELEFYMGEIERAAIEHFGVEPGVLDSEFLAYAAEAAWQSGKIMEPEVAFREAVNDYSAAASMDLLDDTGTIKYEGFYEGDPEYRPEDFADARGRTGPESATGDEAAGASGAGLAGTGEEGGRIPLEDLPAEEVGSFLDPDGDAVLRQTDALEHDAIVAMDRAAQERALNAQIGLAPTVAAERRAATLADAKKAVQDFIGKPMANRGSGITAVLSGNSLRKIVSQSAVGKSTSVVDHVTALANLDRLFEVAQEFAVHADGRGEPTVRAIRRFVSIMESKDGRVAVKMTVKETQAAGSPNPLYSLETISLEKIGSSGLAPHNGIERAADAIDNAPRTGPDIHIDDASILDNGAATDPAIAARDRQEAQLRAAAPLRSKAEQDGTMGLGLFDQADQAKFNLGDGEPTDLRGLFDKIDGDADDIGTIRDCMMPKPKGDA